MADKIESTMLVIRLVPPGIEPTVPLPVRDGVYTGRSMDKVYVQCGHARDRVNSITLLGAASACWVDGIEEFCFDQLANFPAVAWLSVEADCLMGHEGVVMWRILRQFHEAYPERSICLTTHAIGPMEGQVLLCDLTDSVP